MSELITYKSLPILIGLFIGCGAATSDPVTPVVPEANLIEVLNIDHTGDNYFSHLGYLGGVLPDQNYVIIDREGSKILKIDRDGNLLSRTYEGRGPGELLDLANITVTKDGDIYTYDQNNSKIVRYNSELELIEEIIPPAFEAAQVSKIYPTKEETLYELFSFASLYDPDKENIKLVASPNDDNTGIKWIKEFKAFPYAPMIGGGGSTRVPFTNSNLFAYSKWSETVFSFDTKSNVIAELNSEMDTIRTIEIDLPRAELTKEEKDSLKIELEDFDYQRFLPDMKSVASRMFIDKSSIWLKTNLSTDSALWAVLDLEGTLKKWVRLDKEAMLLFVEEGQIGVRENDSTFAIYNVQPDPETNYMDY